MTRVAMISLHTSPLAQPGAGDSGGMNVYVREVGSALAQAGVDVTTYTRRTCADTDPEVLVEPGHRVIHLPAGPCHLPKEALPDVLDEFGDGLAAHIAAGEPIDVIHANYWLSGIAGHRLKHELDVPLVSTFHTLARVKAEGGDSESSWRELAEHHIVSCSDTICVSCDADEEQFRSVFGNPVGRLEIVPPAVEHAFFAPGTRAGARSAIELPPNLPVVLFVGRMQPLKGPDLAIRALDASRCSDAVLVMIGGASGSEGDAEMARSHDLVDELGLLDRVVFVEPQPHHILSTYYRAADVVVVPSRSESFGLVALEAAACGIPVVAARVGGLRSLVDDGRTGVLVDGRDPSAFAAALDSIIQHPARADTMGAAASVKARRFTWAFTAARLRRLYADLSSRDRVLC